MRKIHYYIVEEGKDFGLCKEKPNDSEDTEETVLFRRKGEKTWYKTPLIGNYYISHNIWNKILTLCFDELKD